MKQIRYCCVPGCELPVRCKQLCRRHYDNKLRKGDPLAPMRSYVRGAPTERYWAKVDVREAGECWPWTAGINNYGYGKLGFGSQSSPAMAHRFGYELVNGPIPEGMTVDHLCSNRLCQNPAHMELVTHGENSRRGWERRKSA
jgi:hypothetical protein